MVDPRHIYRRASRHMFRFSEFPKSVLCSGEGPFSELIYFRTSGEEKEDSDNKSCAIEIGADEPGKTSPTKHTQND